MTDDKFNDMIEERMGKTGRNIEFLLSNIAERHMVVDVESEIDRASKIIERIVLATSSAQRFRAMEELESFGMRCIVQLGIIKYTSDLLSHIKNISDMDGTTEVIASITGDKPKKKGECNG